MGVGQGGETHALALQLTLFAARCHDRLDDVRDNFEQGSVCELQGSGWNGKLKLRLRKNKQLVTIRSADETRRVKEADWTYSDVMWCGGGCRGVCLLSIQSSLLVKAQLSSAQLDAATDRAGGRAA